MKEDLAIPWGPFGDGKVALHRDSKAVFQARVSLSIWQSAGASL
jgi:hypothetical protein